MKSYAVDVYQNRRGEEILIPSRNILFCGEIVQFVTFYHFNTNPNFPLFSLSTGNILWNAFPVMNGSIFDF